MVKKLQEFYITIKETLKRSIIVEAEDVDSAIEYTEALCNNDIVELNAEDFNDRELELEKKGEMFLISKSVRRYRVDEGEVDE